MTAVECAIELLIGVPTIEVFRSGTSDWEESFQVGRTGRLADILKAGLSRSGIGG